MYFNVRLISRILFNLMNLIKISRTTFYFLCLLTSCLFVYFVLNNHQKISVEPMLTSNSGKQEDASLENK
jgi:hypothetical protein